MFCSNCGSKLQDGANFCSVCGTRLVVNVVAPAVETAQKPVINEVSVPKTVEVAPQPSVAEVKTVVEPAPVAETKRTKIAFDWSSVKDEPVKKVIPEVKSPWTESKLEKELFEEMTPSTDRSRTLSFIDILKQEKAEQERQVADAVAEPVANDFSPYEDAPSFYVPPMYDVEETPAVEMPAFEAPVIEESPVVEAAPVAEPAAPVIEEPAFTAPVFEKSIFDIPAFDDSAYQTPVQEPVVEEAVPVVEEIAVPVVEEVVPAVEEVAVPVVEEVAPAVEEVAVPVVEEVAPVVEEVAPIVEEVASISIEDAYLNDTFEDQPEYDLEAELDAILGEARSSRVSRAERYAEEPAEVVEEEAAPIVEEVAPVVEEVAPVVEEIEPVAEAVAEEDDFEIDFGKQEDTVASTGTIAMPSDDEAEIEALKRRLAELMGTPYVEEPAPVVEEVVPVVEEVAPVVEEVAPVVEEAAPVVEEVVPVTEEAEPVVEEVADSDALSLDELEKDLFGEITEDEPVEATKKIDKFYTLYKKNEEFQRLLDEEYNKLKADDEINVDDLIAVPEEEEPAEAPEEAEETSEPVEAAAEVAAETPAAAPVELEEEKPMSKKEAKKAAKAAAKAEKEAAREAKKAAKASKADVVNDEEEEAGGGILTVLAVIVALLLVVLLAVILILNFAPDSGAAMFLDSLIQNITSYFSDVVPSQGNTLL